jgi:hypothetical protein
MTLLYFGFTCLCYEFSVMIKSGVEHVRVIGNVRPDGESKAVDAEDGISHAVVDQISEARFHETLEKS